MKIKPIFIIATLLLTMYGCADFKTYIKTAQEIPVPPYGTPDRVDTFNSGYHQSLTYIYFCYQGRYLSITYRKEHLIEAGRDSLGPMVWRKHHVYTSDCIK